MATINTSTSVNTQGSGHRALQQSTSNTCIASDEDGDRLKSLPNDDERLRYLAAIVESSDDAIVTKNLQGYITSWNSGAERLFGFARAEAVGKHITIIIPEDRLEEEREILARLRAGERIDHFETVRRRNDGSLVNISLTVSPVKDGHGNVVGASKIARDISERRRAAEQQELMLREMHHRVRNLFTLASSIVTMSARSALSPKQLAETACNRLRALATAQTLTMRPLKDREKRTRFQTLLRCVLEPFWSSQDQKDISMSVLGDDPELANNAATGLALVIHELATNAVKYGGLSPAGHGVSIQCNVDTDEVRIQWRESGVTMSDATDGFGSWIIKATIEHQLHGTFLRTADPNGLIINMAIPAAKLRDD